MQVGIIAEGPADIAVLRNILKGRLGLERKDVLPIRPELSEDETDLGAPGRAGSPVRGREGFSNWLLVLEECRQRTKLEAFLESPLEEDRFVVVHIDTAEAHLKGFDVVRPNDRRAATYSEELRASVVAKINALVGEVLAARVCHAVAVEETDAWVLTLHDNEDKRDTGARLDPKKRLEFLLERQRNAGGSARGRRRPSGRHRRSEYERYHELTLDFREGDKLDRCTKRNRSLKLFVDSLDPLAQRSAP